MNESEDNVATMFEASQGVQRAARRARRPASQAPDRRIAVCFAVLCLLAVAPLTARDTPAAGSRAQAGSAQEPIPAGPVFEVVSIRPNTSGDLGSTRNERPDGGFTMTNVLAASLIGWAYGIAPVDMEGLPEWATSDRYDVSTTSSIAQPTPDERSAMLRAMLAARFRLRARVENRDEPAFDLVVAQSDGRLGPEIQPSEVDCVAQAQAEREAAERARAAGVVPPPRALPDLNAPVPPCSVRMIGPRMEGDMTMESLARFIRSAAGRPVVDRTGLVGSFRVTLVYDRMAGLRGLDAATVNPDAPPSVFTAVQEQLGLRLVSSRAGRTFLVIERLERPTEN